MLRSFNTSVSSRALFAVAAEAGAENEKAEKGQAVVYLNGDDTLKSVILYAEAAATANLQFCASIVVHLVARCYTPVLRDRVAVKDVQTEVLNAIREHGKAKRGKEFGRAWSYRILQLALRMGRSLMTDYDRKGVVEGSPLHDVLRAKTPDKGVEIVTGYMAAKCKTANGGNDLQTLEKAFELGQNKPGAAKAGKNAKSRKGQGKGKASNNVKADTAVATKTLNNDETAVIAFQNVKAKSAKDRAEKLADRIGKANNVNHKAFVLRSLAHLSAEELIEVSQACLDLAAKLEGAGDKAENTGKMEAAG